MRPAVVLIALIVCVALARPASAQSAIESWLAQDTATGDWVGLRSRAEAAGLTVEGNYQTDLMGNPVGGEKHGFAYAGLAEISLDFDLGTIASREGTSFFISGWWASGRDLSDRDIGNAIDVSQVFDGRSVRLGQVYLEQDLLDGALNLVAGRISTGDDFATSELYENYVSSGVTAIRSPWRPICRRSPAIRWRHGACARWPSRSGRFMSRWASTMPIPTSARTARTASISASIRRTAS